MDTDPKSEDECLAWVGRGECDVRSAQLLIHADFPVPESACFHAQQAAEKVIKAFLVSRMCPFARTHNLGVLLREAIKMEPAFFSLQDDCDFLTPYAVETRYPGEIGKVEPEEGLRSIASMSRIWRAIADHLPSASRELALNSLQQIRRSQSGSPGQGQ